MALRMGAKFLGNYRLLGTILYVTLEPCVMCLGALIHARIYRLVYGAIDNKIGCEIWLKSILNHPLINHCVILTTGVLKRECSILLNNFFKKKEKLQ